MSEDKIIKKCQGCGQNQKQLLRCSRCRKIYYCGAECQKNHWPTHKLNCSKAKQNIQSLESTTKNTETQKKSDPQNPFHGLNEFDKLTHIGSGNFSEIFKAVSKKDNKTYAIKQVQKAKVQRIRKQADLFMEKHCLSKLKECDYAIKLYRTFQDQLNLFIQMECPENGQIWDQAKTFGFFSEPLFKYYASHLVKALSIIHNDYEIVHRDLKPENILLNEKNQIKIIDFGTAKDLSRPDIKGSGNGLKGKQPFEHYVGTPNYMAPECIRNKASQKKSDIYSLSGIFYFMKVGAPPFTGGSQFIVFKKSLQTDLFLCNQLFSPELRNLITYMNKKSMEQRYDIDSIMKHQYFKDINWENLPTYSQILTKCSELENYLWNQSKQLFKNYQKVAHQGDQQTRKKVYDNQIYPILQKLTQKQNIPFEIRQQDCKYLYSRIEMMKIQAKVMMNYYQDNSVGFTQIYKNDFNSAERIINQVKSNIKDDQDIEESQINMKKKVE